MRLIDADEFEDALENTEYDISPAYEPDGYSHRLICKVLEEAPTVDAVPVVRCRECKFWMPEHIERDDGSIMLYEQLPRMEPGMAPIEFGVNVGSYCTLCENVVTHGFRDGNPCLDCTRLWRREDDYCSRGQRRDQSADVRNMGQFAGGGKTGGPNDADQH
nr:MAG TPA: hypothetical protein [Caudoviricetes sp.]